MLVDEVVITIKAGHGGAGKVSFGPARFSGPDGGNGGRGGDVYIEATTDLYALNYFTKTKLVEGENGHPGGGVKKYGEDGKDVTIKMPIGTELTDLNSGEVFELKDADQKILIAKGGLGGRGNFEFRSPSNTTPRYAQPGLFGQERKLKVNLKLIADFGLIGLPNAGKSSLLNELTNANAKIGDYQFTTLEPNLGVVDGKILADIPGLIEGASSGKGLGIKFLKHIERVGTLLHCVASDSENPKKDYQTIRKELGEYNPELLEKKEIILLTKTDLLDSKELGEKIKILKKLNPEVISVSIHDFDSLEKLKNILI